MASASSINPADQEPCLETKLLSSGKQKQAKDAPTTDVWYSDHEKAYVVLLLWSFFIKALENVGPYSQKFQGK